MSKADRTGPIGDGETGGTGNTGCATITEFHPAGDTVGLISVRDADDLNTPNAWVTFSIEAGDEDGTAF
jgi:hypothetical protein